MANKVLALTALFIGFVLIGLPEKIFATNSKDGFNIYKDLLRGKGDEEDDMIELVEDPRNSKVSYFYRTPAFGSSSLRGGQIPSDLGKRTLNRFKNYMLGKENLDEEMRKRGAGTFLSWALANRQNYNEGRSSFPGVNRPAAFVDQ